GVGAREAVAAGIEELGTIAALWPGAANDVRRATAELERALPRGASAGPRDARVPARAGEVRGPLDVYYYDHLRRVLGERAPTPLERRGDVFAYEALNLVDGKRSVSDIRDILAGRYAPVPVAEVAEWFDVLARAGVVRLAGRGGPRIGDLEHVALGIRLIDRRQPHAVAVEPPHELHVFGEHHDLAGLHGR